MGYRHIVHGNIFKTFISEAGSQYIGCIFRVAVYRCISDHDTLVFRLISAPFLILFNEPLNIFSPYRTVERTDHPDFHIGSLL